MTTIFVRNARPNEAQAIFELNGAVYNSVAANHASFFVPPLALMRHIEGFPEGVFVAEATGQIAAFAITMRTHRSPHEKALLWHDAIGGLDLKAHNPKGEWLYGIDFGVHPQFRKRGLGSMMYKARFEMVKALNLRGFYAGGMLLGYKNYPHLSLEEYGERVKRGLIKDPTVTMQMNRGFKPIQVIQNYCGKNTLEMSAMLIAWNNPDYRATGKALGKAQASVLQA